MDSVLILLIALAIVGIVVFGICFLAIKGYKFKASADAKEKKIEVALENNSENPKQI